MNKSRRLVIVGLPAALLARPAGADQPHMEAARDHLRSAERELEKATADKGGHRANALKLVRQAIAEVDRGITFDRRH
jgi:RNase P/RNase MRP subunit p30